jgi:hypothetical protein
MTKDLHLKLVAAWWDGELEFNYYDTGWSKAKGTPANDSSLACYRIRPKPTLRPWKPEEVPMPCLLKVRPDCLAYVYDKKLVWQALAVTSDGVAALSPTTGLGVVQDFKTMLDIGLCSVDGGKTWSACGVEESK